MLSIQPSTVDDHSKAVANDLFKKAQAAANEKNGSEAIRLVIQALKFDPDHEAIRGILGFKRYDDLWRSDWEISRLKQGYVDHPDFGWMPEKQVEQYEAGMRFVQKIGWITADDASLIRSDIRNGWEIQTEHYLLKTNHSLEEGVETTRRLEHLHRAWNLLFFHFLYDDESLVKAFQGKLDHVSQPRHQVFLYRDKNDYVACLQGIEPRIAASNGFYFPKIRRAYFFPVSKNMDAHESDIVRKTIYHEGTHQLFQEAKLSSKTIPGVRNNFWIVEGIAMFMETFRIEKRKEKDCYVIGDIRDSRLDAAKFHKTDENFYVPFGNLVRFGVNDFLSHPKLSKLYSQSAAMTHFLMLRENGEKHDRIIQLLKTVYNGSSKIDSLSVLTDSSYNDLDEEYFQFLEIIPLPD